MKFVGVGIYKNTIRICVMVIEAGKRKVALRRRLGCYQTKLIRSTFEGLGKSQLVVEAAASYEWLLLLIEDLADCIFLAHPKKAT